MNFEINTEIRTQTIKKKKRNKKTHQYISFGSGESKLRFG